MNMKVRAAFLAAFSLSACVSSGTETRPETLLVYFGTYAGADSNGIHVYRMDTASGELTPVSAVSGVANPSFLAIHPGGRFLYATCETGSFGGKKSGSVAAFSLEPGTGKLSLLNQESSEGTSPCHLVVDRQGKNVLVANYSSGTAAVLPIGADGRVGAATGVVKHEGSGVNKRRQEGPHAHSINLDAANRFAFVADLGLDRVMVYRYDAAKGTLTPNDPPSAAVAPGSGPRHFAFHPDGRRGYVINEMLSTVTAFDYDGANGTLKEVQTVPTLPEGFQGPSTTAEVRVTPDGKFLYGSNRGHDSLAIFAVDAESGRLTFVGHEPTQGKTPRNFGIDPTGTWLLAANQGSDSVVVFRIDPKTGKLKAAGTVLKIPKPVCVKFLARP